MQESPSSSGGARSGRNGPRAVAEFTDRLTRKSLGRRGFAVASLIADWPAVVGSALGAATLPLRIVFRRGERGGGTLHLKVASGALALELQHQERLVIERINGHFGYGAIARLALVQGPVPQRGRPRVKPPLLSADQERDLAERLTAVADPELRSALTRLGRHLAAGH